MGAATANSAIAKSVLLKELRGVVFVSGRRGVGKSFFCATAENPELVCFLDYEAKGESLHEQLGFGAYHSVTEKASNGSGKGPLAIWEETERIIREMPANKFTTVIIDNVSPLELGLTAEANRNVKQYVTDFGLNLSNVQSGRFGGLKSVVNFLVTTKITAPLHAKGVKVILVTAHISPKWAAGGPVPNKYSIKGADRWQELSIMTLILTSGEHAPIPAAIVQKEQLGRATYNIETGEFEILRRLPLRLPKCTWREVKRYLAEPADLDNPASGERPTPNDIEQFSEELSKEQLAIMIEQMRAEKEANAVISATLNNDTATLDPNADVINQIKAYRENNPDADNAAIMRDVPGATLALVIKARMNK